MAERNNSLKKTFINTLKSSLEHLGFKETKYSAAYAESDKLIEMIYEGNYRHIIQIYRVDRKYYFEYFIYNGLNNNGNEWEVIDVPLQTYFRTKSEFDNMLKQVIKEFEGRE